MRKFGFRSMTGAHARGATQAPAPVCRLAIQRGFARNGDRNINDVAIHRDAPQQGTWKRADLPGHRGLWYAYRMPELLIAIGVNVLIGALTALIIYLSRNSSKHAARLADARVAMHLFRRRFPDANGTATVTADGRNALIDLGEGAGVGLLQAHGQRWNARILHAGDVASLTASGYSTLELRLTDYANPRASLLLPDTDAQFLWLGRLRNLGHA